MHTIWLVQFLQFIHYFLNDHDNDHDANAVDIDIDIDSWLLTVDCWRRQINDMVFFFR